MNPRYPVYIVSKGRWESRLTARALDSLDVPYSIVVEPQEFEQYSAVIDPHKILTLPFSNLRQGSIPARNWIWEHAIAAGVERHWILDDNIGWFGRLLNNRKYRMTTGTCFYVIEEFVDRYENVALSGMQYEFFLPRKDIFLALLFNTRIYSCILIRNDLPYRWCGRYNEDTDLSLRVLKDGWCTILFNAFFAKKITTMKMKGGNTDELYRNNGRLLMALSLREQHPDVVSITKKYGGRPQHLVNYKPFAGNKLIRKQGVEIHSGIEEFDMRAIYDEAAA